MINAGFNPLMEISRKTGKSMGVLKDEMSKGAVSAQMVQQAFISATSEGGKFFKMSENASKTINGQISMMEDATDAMFNEIGKASEGFIVNTISGVTSLIENYETAGKVLVGLIATYGTYKAALLLVTAVEKAQAVQRLASIKHIKAMSAAVGLLTKKIGILNAVMKLNPYAAVTAALVALVAAVWNLSESTSSASEALKEYNKHKEESIRKEKEHKEKIEALIDKAKDESLATLERQKSLRELKREYPNIFKEYDLEKLKLEDILSLKKQINEEESHRTTEGRKEEYKELQRTVNLQKRYIALFNSDNRANMSPEDRKVWDMFRGYPISEVKAQMKKDSAKLKMYQKDILKDTLASYEANIKDFSDEKLKRELEMARSGPSMRNGFPIDGKMVKGQSLEDVIGALEAEQKKRAGNNSNYGKDFKEARAKWEEKKKLLKEVEDDRSKFTTEIYKKRKAEAKAAEAAFKALGGDVNGRDDKALDKQTKKQNEILRQNEKISSLQERYSKEFVSQQENVERRAAQARIDAMDEGSEKVAAQRELDNRVELEDIERQKQDYIRKYIQSQKEIFDAKEELKAREDSKYKKKEFDASSVNVDTSAFDTLSSEVIRKQGAEAIEAQKEVWDEYLQEFGSFEERRSAIEEKYNRKIKSAVSSGGIYEAMTATVERNKALAELEKDKDGLLSYVERAFSDISDLSDESLDVLIKKLEEYRRQAAETFDTEDIEKYEQVLRKLNDAKLENKFGLLKDMIPEVFMEQIRLQNEINAAQEESNRLEAERVNLAYKVSAKEQEILDIIEEQTGERPDVESLRSDSGLQGIWKLFEERGKDSSKAKGAVGELVEMKTGLNNVTSASEKAKGKLGSLFNMKGGGAASTVAVIDAIVNGINDMVHGVSRAFDEIKETKEALGKDTGINTRIGKLSAGMRMFSEASQGATDAWNSLKKGDMGGVFAGVTKSFTGWIKGFAAIHDAKHEKRIEGLQKRVDSLSKSYDKLGDSIEEAYSHDAQKLIEEQNRMLEQQKFLIYKQIQEEEKKKKTNHKRVDEWKEQIDDINKLIEDNKKSAVDAIFGEDIKSAIDDFTNAYLGSWDKGEDRAKSVRDMVKKMMQQMVAESIKGAVQSSKSMEEIRHKMQEFYADKILDKSEQEYIYELADKLRKEMESQFGWADGLMNEEEKKPYEQEASSKAFGSMSQETAEELNGRFTAMYESDLRREQILTEQLSFMKGKTPITDVSGSIGIITASCGSLNDIADETRTILANSYIELQQIRENTEAIIKPIRQIQEDIAEVKRNTDRL